MFKYPVNSHHHMEPYKPTGSQSIHNTQKILYTFSIPTYMFLSFIYVSTWFKIAHLQRSNTCSLFSRETEYKILDTVEAIQDHLDDHLLKTQIMRGSPYFKAFEGTYWIINALESRMNYVVFKFFCSKVLKVKLSEVLFHGRKFASVAELQSFYYWIVKYSICNYASPLAFGLLLNLRKMDVPSLPYQTCMHSFAHLKFPTVFKSQSAEFQN